MAAARKPSETFNPYSGVIFIELFTLPAEPAFGQTKWVYGYTSSRNDKQVCHPKKAHTCPVRPCSRNILSEFFFKHTENTVLLHSGQDLLKHLLRIIIRISPYIVNAGY